MRLTRWDFLNSDQREGHENTEYGLRCYGCDIFLATKADFAKHFIVTDTRFLNLGHCPNKFTRETIYSAYGPVLIGGM